MISNTVKTILHAGLLLASTTAFGAGTDGKSLAWGAAGVSFYDEFCDRMPIDITSLSAALGMFADAADMKTARDESLKAFKLVGKPVFCATFKPVVEKAIADIRIRVGH